MQTPGPLQGGIIIIIIIIITIIIIIYEGRQSSLGLRPQRMILFGYGK